MGWFTPEIAGYLLVALGVYLLVGVVFSIAFLVRGVRAIDPVAAESSLPVRLIWAPGAAALWPVLALKWLRSDGGVA